MRGSLTDEKKESGKAGVVEDTNKAAKAITDEISNVVLGKEQTIEMLMAGVLANGNILFEDFPGLAKTLMSNSLADALGCEFKRIQFTPDMLPADLIGTLIYNQKTGDFVTKKGPIFSNIILADKTKLNLDLLISKSSSEITLQF